MGKCCRCFTVPNISAPITVTGVTGASPTTLVSFTVGRKCFKVPTTIQISIASVTGVGTGTISLINTSTGAVLATGTISSTAPSILTLTVPCSSYNKCNTLYSIIATATVTAPFSFVINGITSSCS